ncbi:MAG TPA: hypothetical protein VJK04_02355 [Candidatus Paceibacterota bacterium]
MNGDENKFFSEKPLESDIERLSQEVKEVKKQPEFQHAPPKEIIKQSLRSLSGSSAQLPSNNGAQNDDVALFPNYMQSAQAADRAELQQLIQMSLRDGFEAGIREARKHGAFMVDAIHDALSEKVYPELKRRGVLE